LGHAKEYVELMWRMLQLDKPTDLVIATGKSQTVKHFINLVASALDLKIFWEGSGINEIAKDINGKIIIKIDSEYVRPLEVDNLTGDPTTAKKLLNWSPKITINELVREMVDYELKFMSLGAK
jgi:GDPmannose 4,6-dehydratase